MALHERAGGDMGGRKRDTKSEREPSVPAAMRDRFAALSALTDHVCKEHLDGQYA
jgi:hypothetical protein